MNAIRSLFKDIASLLSGNSFGGYTTEQEDAHEASAKVMRRSEAARMAGMDAAKPRLKEVVDAIRKGDA